MEEFAVLIMLSFLFFAIILPLIGVLIGLFCYYVLPYLFGGIVVLSLAVLGGAKFILGWWIWLLALIWASSVHFIHRKLKSLGHEVEHYRAAYFMLLGGIPFHRKRNELKQSLPQEC